jgi:hypothetical protein
MRDVYVQITLCFDLVAAMFIIPVPGPDPCQRRTCVRCSMICMVPNPFVFWSSLIVGCRCVTWVWNASFCTQVLHTCLPFNGGMPRFCNHKPRSSSNGAQYVALQKRKSDEAESKHVGLAQQNGFGPAFLHRRIWRLGNSTTKLNTCCWFAW